MRQGDARCDNYVWAVLLDSLDHLVNVWLFDPPRRDQKSTCLGDCLASIHRDKAHLDRILTERFADCRESHRLALPALLFEALEDDLFELFAVFEILESGSGCVQLELLEVIQLKLKCIGKQLQLASEAGARH